MIAVFLFTLTTRFFPAEFCAVLGQVQYAFSRNINPSRDTQSEHGCFMSPMSHES